MTTRIINEGTMHRQLLCDTLPCITLSCLQLRCLKYSTHFFQLFLHVMAYEEPLLP